jgi:hypothetical protein
VLHVSNDGTLLLLQRAVVERDGAAASAEGLVSLIDLRTGEQLASLPASGLIEPVDLPGRGHGIAWSSGDRTWSVSPGFEVRELDLGVSRFVWLGREEAFAHARDGSCVHLDLAASRQTKLERDLRELVVSPGGRAWGGALAAPDQMSRIFVSGAARRDVTGHLLWVGDDGASLLLAGGRLSLLDARGAERSSAASSEPLGSWRTEVAGDRLVALAGGSLHVFALDGSTHDLLASDVVSFTLDREGARIAIVVETSPEDDVPNQAILSGGL